ncbi:transglycosylase SLT domain-containing protein [Frigidibacter sp. MR17.24]|uniref:transglycosylase SLT domain-containing protein n=1 Tax=Frigidibacter sp. MR17.24 TaxID=3127345 RepID=UPI0030131592
MRQTLACLSAPALLVAATALSGCMQTGDGFDEPPAMRWDHRPEAAEWTQAAISALASDGAVLATTVPADIETFCPNYAEASLEERQAFWSGLFSALAQFESTWNPKASGGGGAWIGLLQIAPSTARAYSCDATSTSGLKDGAANLSCAVKIAARQVPRDNAIVDNGAPGWEGLARDWAPMRSSTKVKAMAAWTSKQSYCVKPGSRA